MVDRAVEEALDLAGVQVDRDHPLGARGLEQVGDEAGGDRLAALGLAVLAGVAVERADRGDALGRRPVGGVDHDQLLHDRVVDAAPVAAVVGLHDEHVAAADALGESGADLAVGELDQVGVAELDAEVLGDLLGQRGVRAPGVERHALGRDLFHVGLRGARSVGRCQCRRRRSTVPTEAPCTRRQVGVRPDVRRRRRSRLRGRHCARRRRRRPTTQSTRRVSGPISQPSPTTVLPCRIVPGYSVTSRPSCTVTSMKVWRGSSIVTPLSSQCRFVRLRSSRSASASCQRSLTPWVSASGAWHGADLVAHAGQHLDDVGEVVLALGVVGAEPAQRRPEQVAAERVHARPHLADRERPPGSRRVVRRPAEPARHLLRGRSQHSAVAGRIVEDAR